MADDPTAAVPSAAPGAVASASALASAPGTASDTASARSSGTPPVSGPRRAWLRTHRWPLLAGLVVALALAAGAWRWWQGALVSTEPVIRRDLVQTVVASGRVETPHRLDIGVQIIGTVRRVPVSEGQQVVAGDVLVELEAAELAATGRQADVAVLQAQARLRQLQEVQGPVAAQVLRQAQANLANAQAALARSRALFEQGFVGQAALDDARRAVALADADARASQRQLDTTAATGSDRALALANVAGAQAQAEASRARSGYAVLRAPVAGTLIARDVEVGDVVQPGKLLMTLSPRGRTQLVVAIDEKNLALLAVGQPALASADAYPARRFAATLAYINPGVDATTGAVEVKLDTAAAPVVLRQDMTVSVDIEVARRSQVLIVPLAAVNDAAAAAWVLRLEGRHAVRRPVRLGLRGGGLAEVLDGLAEGDAVLVGPAGILPGARVRPQPPAAAAAGSAPA